MTVATPTFTLEIGFGSGVQTPPASIVWTDVTDRALGPDTMTGGRSYELDTTQPGQLTTVLDNLDGRFTPPGPPGSPYAGKVLIGTPIRYSSNLSGTTRVLWQGTVQRWPVGFDSSAIWTQTPVQAGDILTPLAQIVLGSVLTNEIEQDLPIGYWPCTDTSTALVPAQAVAAGPPLTVQYDAAPRQDVLPAFGVALPTLPGAGFTTTTGVGSSTGMTIGSQVTGSTVNRCALLAALPALVAAPSIALETWYATTGPGMPIIASSVSSGLRVYLNGGAVSVAVDILNGGVVTQQRIVSTAIINDGALHHIVAQVTSIPTRVLVFLTVDGVQVGYSIYPGTTTGSGGHLMVGSPFTPTTTGDGTYAHIAVYLGGLTADRVAAHYFAGRTARAGESSSARATAIAGYAGYPVAAVIGAGSSLMGPADLAGKTLAGALQDVATSENGYLGTQGGALVFAGRASRYNTAVAWQLGGPGQPSITAPAYDYDPTYVYNDISVARVAGGTSIAGDLPSQAQYGKRSLQLALGVSTDLEIADAAQYLLSQHKDAALRLASLVVVPSSDPTLWPFVLGAKVGDRVTVTSRASDGQTISADYFLESIDHAHDVRTKSWVTTCHASPAAMQDFWQLEDPTYGALGPWRLAY